MMEVCRPVMIACIELIVVVGRSDERFEHGVGHYVVAR